MRLSAISYVFYTLSFMIVFFNDGGVYPVALAVSVVLMALSVALAAATQGIHRPTAWVFERILLIWFVISLWIVAQSMPLPSAFDSVANPVWTTLRQTGIDVAGRIAVLEGEAFPSLLAISLPFMTVIATLMLFRTDRQVELGLSVFALTGSGFAIFAVVQFVLFPGTLMFAPKQAYIDRLTAPFVNANTAATFYGLAIIAVLSITALYIANPRRESKCRWRSLLSDPRILASLLIPLTVALALTRSRAGISASVFSSGLLITALFIHFVWTRSSFGELLMRHSRRCLLTVILGCLVLVSAGGLLIFSRAIQRSEVQVYNDGRTCVMPGMWDAIGDNWALGIGPGGLQYYFPAYRGPECNLNGVWLKAHNFYLDTIMSLGSVVAAAVIWMFLFIVVTVFRAGLHDRKSRRPLVLGGIASVLLTAAHSVTDFSLQIPGFAMCFAMFLGLVATISRNLR